MGFSELQEPSTEPTSGKEEAWGRGQVAPLLHADLSLRPSSRGLVIFALERGPAHRHG